MAYDREIEKVVDAIFAPEDGLASKKMFGGVCYLFEGNMAFGILNDSLIIRLGDPEQAEVFIEAGRALAFDITGRAMKGWVMVPKANLAGKRDYREWLEKGLKFAKSLPPK